MWKARFDIVFRRQYGKLDSHLKKQVKDAIEEILVSEDPAKLREPKRGHLRHFHAYELGNQYRIIYHISYNTKRIIFVSVGSHKEVYSKN